MKVPKYIQSILEDGKVSYNYEADYSVGYTINVSKPTPYTKIDTFKKNIERLCDWVSRQPGGEAHILYMPERTRHSNQYCTITIFDPVMMVLEPFFN